MNNAILIDEKDNVAVAIEPITGGENVLYRTPTGEEHCVAAREDITIYHKIAIRDISGGEKIVKYGEHIGEAACDILAGSHVHTQNVTSVRENLDEQLGETI